MVSLRRLIFLHWLAHFNRCEVELLDLFEAACVYINDRGVYCSTAIRCCLLWCAAAFNESDLASILEVPALVLLVVVRVETLLAEVTEVVGGDVGLGAVVWDNIFLLPTVCTIGFT